MASNPFDDIEKEDMTGSGSKIYLKPGTYQLLKINRCEHVAASKFKKKEFFKAEIEVLQSGVESRPAGTVCEYMVMKTLKDGSPNAHYWKNIKKLLMAAFNTDDHTDIDADLMLLVTGEKQSAAGKYLSAVATDIDVGDNGGKFTVVEWKHEAAPKKKALAEA